MTRDTHIKKGLICIGRQEFFPAILFAKVIVVIDHSRFFCCGINIILSSKTRKKLIISIF